MLLMMYNILLIYENKSCVDIDKRIYKRFFKVSPLGGDRLKLKTRIQNNALNAFHVNPMSTQN